MNSSGGKFAPTQNAQGFCTQNAFLGLALLCRLRVHFSLPCFSTVAGFAVLGPACDLCQPHECGTTSCFLGELFPLCSPQVLASLRDVLWRRSAKRISPKRRNSPGVDAGRHKSACSRAVCDRALPSASALLCSTRSHLHYGSLSTVCRCRVKQLKKKRGSGHTVRATALRGKDCRQYRNAT